MKSDAISNDSKKRFFVYHLPVIIYAGLIIAVSSIPDFKSPKISDIQLDKVAHFLEYALFSFLIYRSMVHLSQRIAHNRALILSSILVICFACLDEFFQRFIPGRDSGLGDLITDLVGAGLVLILLWIRGKSSKQE